MWEKLFFFFWIGRACLFLRQKERETKNILLLEFFREGKKLGREERNMRRRRKTKESRRFLGFWRNERVLAQHILLEMSIFRYACCEIHVYLLYHIVLHPSFVFGHCLLIWVWISKTTHLTLLILRCSQVVLGVVLFIDYLVLFEKPGFKSIIIPYIWIFGFCAPMLVLNPFWFFLLFFCFFFTCNNA